MDAARELVKVGLTEFEDYIRANRAVTLRRAPRTRRETPDPEMEQARQELTQYAQRTDRRRQIRHKAILRSHGRTQKRRGLQAPSPHSRG